MIVHKLKIIVCILAMIVLICFFSSYSHAIDTQTLTEKQKAVLSVAYAFLDRGDALQYDSYGLCRFTTNAGTTGQYNTRQTRHLSPEMAAGEDKMYTVCSGFTYSVYEEALGIQIPELTKNLMEEAKANQSNQEYIPLYEEVSDTSDIQKIEKALEPGDIIVY